MRRHTLPRLLAVALACSAGFLAWSAPAIAQTSKKNPVVVVIFDEFSTASLLDKTGKAIHKKRFPNFHRLSREGAWYRKHTTVADFTYRAVPAILTGKLRESTFADYRIHPDSIYSLLKEAGYRFRNFEWWTQVCPPDTCGPPGREFLDYLEGEETHGRFSYRIATSISGAERVERRRNWMKDLGSLRPGEAAVGHLPVPHSPYHRLPDCRSYRDRLEHPFRRDKTDHGSAVISNRRLLESYGQRRLFQVACADTILGQLIASIKKSGQWNDTMLVVTGDHGISFKSGFSARNIVSENRHEISLTPLLVKYPDRRSVGRQEAMSRSIDILPTIADTLGLERSYPMDGKPLRTVPNDRQVGARDAKGSFFPISLGSVDRWLKQSARDQTRSQGNLGLEALGPVAKAIGKRAPKIRLKRPKRITIADLDSLQGTPEPNLPPALVQGYVRSGLRGPSVGSRLLLAVNGRLVASTSVYSFEGRRAFAFLIHPNYLDNRGLRKVKVFQVRRSGKKIRIF